MEVTDGFHRLGHNAPMRTQIENDSKHGNRTMSERRMSVDEQIVFYQLQAKLARSGYDTTRSPEFYDRQIWYFEQVKLGVL